MKYLFWRNLSQYVIVISSIINIILNYVKKKHNYSNKSRRILHKIILICSILIIISGLGIWYFNNVIQKQIENERDQAFLELKKITEKSELTTKFYGSFDNKIHYVTLSLTFNPFPSCEDFSNLLIYFRTSALDANYKIKGFKTDPSTYSLTATKTNRDDLNVSSTYSEFLITIQNNQLDIDLFLGFGFEKEYTIRDFQSSFFEFFISSELAVDLKNIKLVLNDWTIFDKGILKSDFFVLNNLRNWMENSESQVAGLRIPNTNRNDCLYHIDFYTITPSKFK